MSKFLVRISAKHYEDEDDCLSAAADDYAAANNLEGWDLAPRFEDDQRECILLFPPSWLRADDCSGASRAVR